MRLTREVCMILMCVLLFKRNPSLSHEIQIFNFLLSHLASSENVLFTFRKVHKVEKLSENLKNILLLI